MKEIKILGTGCPKCRKLLEQTELAVRELGLECDIEKVTDIGRITAYGVMMTPALVVDGMVKTMGKVPSPDELKKLLI
jgi:small redox-active disulfide protein 2